MPPTACSLVLQEGPLGYHTTALIHPTRHPWQQHTSLGEELESEGARGTWVKGKAQVLDLVAQRAELWAPSGSVLCREHSLLS